MSLLAVLLLLVLTAGPPGRRSVTNRP